MHWSASIDTVVNEERNEKTESEREKHGMERWYELRRYSWYLFEENMKASLWPYTLLGVLCIVCVCVHERKRSLLPHRVADGIKANSCFLSQEEV